MQMVKKILIVFILGWLVVIAFMPKKELYYKLEEILQKQSVVMNEKQIDEGVFSLTLHQVDIYVKGIKLITIEKIDFFTLLFYSRVECTNIILDESLKKMAPTRFSSVVASHGIWRPFKVYLDAQGEFGRLNGDVNLKNKSLRVDFNDTKGIEMLKATLKQDEKGWYYETSF